MAIVFGDLQAEARRTRWPLAQLGVLWMREAAGMVTFALYRRSIGIMGRRVRPISSELRWAWRGIQARRWRAILSVALLAVTLAAGTTMFSVADALLYTKAPFRDVHRLVVAEPVWPDLVREWRAEPGLFRELHAYALDGVLAGLTGSPFDGSAVMTPGLIEMLGAVPRLGRTFSREDARAQPGDIALISESFARRRYGDLAAALGQPLQTAAGPVTVVGVMPEMFRFPHGRIRLWRPLSPDAPLPARATILGRLADELPLEVANEVLRSRASPAPTADERPAARPPLLSFEAQFASSGYHADIFPWLLGAAFALLLAGCLNVASLELAWALRGRRMRAVQLTLGMPRALLVRSVLSEALLLALAGIAAGAAVAWFGISLVRSFLPEVHTYSSANRIDLDTRALVFLALCSVPAWVLPAIPVLVIGLRDRTAGLLKDDPRSQVATRAGVIWRRAITAGQVALAVVLLVGAVLTLRTYEWLAYRDRGFDAEGLVRLSVTLPRAAYPDDAAVRAAALELEAALRAMPVVRAVSRVSDLPPYAGWSGVTRVQIEGEPPGDRIALSWYEVTPEFGAVLPVRVIAGRFLLPSDPPEAIVVGERLAARYWPGGDAVGQRFRMGNRPWRQVVGVAATIRHRWSSYLKVSDPYLEMYEPIGPPVVAAQADRPTAVNFGLRLSSEHRLPDVIATAAALNPRIRVEGETVDRLYAMLFEDRRLSASVFTAFATLAIVVTLAGIYGMVAFMVADRRREIGLRVALGAARRDIRRLVGGSMLRVVAAGAGVGVAVSFYAARLLDSQLYGVTPADPGTYLAAALLIAVVAVLAIWQPLRQACRIDPAVTLRAE